MFAFGPDNEDSFYNLYEKISSIGLMDPTKESTTKLQQLINNHKSSLLSLKFSERNADARSKIENNNVEVKGVRSNLPQSLKLLVCQVSDALDLNEMIALSLIFTATKHNPPTTYGAEEYHASIKLFYEEYLKLLLSVVCLFQARYNEELNPHIREVVTKSTTELLKEGLVKSICSRINELTKQINESQNTINTYRSAGNGDSNEVTHSIEQINFRVLIRRSLGDCLFFSCFNLQCDEETFDSVFNCFKHSLNTFNASIEQLIADQNEELTYDALMLIDALPMGSKSIFNMLYMETSTILCLLEPIEGKEKFDPKLEKLVTTNTLYKPQFIQKFDKSLRDLTESMDNPNLVDKPQFEAVIGLMWSLGLQATKKDDFVGYSNNAFDLSLSRKVFEFISKGWLNSKTFRNDSEQTKEFIVYVLSELVCGILTKQSNIIAELLTDQSEKMKTFLNRRRDGLPLEENEDEETISEHVNSLLLLISELYMHYPEYSHRFFEQRELRAVIANTFCEHITSLCKLQEEIDLGFIYYIGILCSFSGDTVGAVNVFRMLCDSPYPLFSWSYFFQTLIPQFQQYNGMSKEDVAFDEKTLDSIYVVLKLVEKICHNSEESRMAFLENGWDILGLLFGLMFVPKLSPVLMGQVFSTLASFVKPSSGPPSKEAQVILAQMERFQILKYEIRNDKYEISNSGGVKYQLNFRESQEGEYFETLGFLELIYSLISCTNYPINGFAPYLKFIQEDVFNNFSKRYYKEDSEKWLIAKSCLQIFTKLLSRYSPSVSDFGDTKPGAQQAMEDENAPKIPTVLQAPPGFQIMNDMLSNTIFRKELFNVIGVNLEEERSTNREGEAMEKSVIYALQMIETTLLKEEAFIQSLSQTQRDVPAVIKRLEYQMPNTLIIKLVDLLDYSFNNEVRYRVVNILCLVSKNITNLVGLFKERKRDKKLVNLFVKHLYAVTFESNRERSDIDDSQVDDNQRDNETRLKMLDLLKSNVDAPGENITHMLCGFDIASDEPREIDIFNEKTCLTIILHLLRSKRLPKTHPRFIESCYELIYKLCADRRVSQQTFACLEKSSFLNDKLMNDNFATKIAPSPVAHHILNQRAFVIRIVALKLYSNTKAFKKGDSNRGGVQELVHILFGGDSLGVANNIFSRSMLFEQRRALMLEVLDTIDLNLVTPNTPYDIASVEWKQFLKNWSSKFNAFSGWKQVVDITLSQCFGMIPDDEIRLRILHDLMNSLLFKLSQMKSNNNKKGKEQQKLDLLVSQLILRIMSKLREELITSGETLMLPVDQCLTIFRNLLECTLYAEQSEQAVRGNLYSALINYLQYTKKNELNAGSSQIQDLQKNNEHVLDRYDISLLPMVCKDALDAKNIWKTVSFSLLETLFLYTTNIAQRGKWINFFEQFGYLKQILDSVMTEAKHSLSKVLHPTFHESDASSLNRLFIYENAMSFLLKFADIDPKSCEIMVTYELLPKLSAHFSFIDLRPSIISHQYGRKVDHEDTMLDDGDWEPSITEKYNQLAIPALKLIISIQSNLRNNKKVAEQVLSFIEQHRKAISSIIKLENVQKNLVYVEPGSLELVRLVCQMFYLLALHPDIITKKLYSNKFERLLLNALLKLSTIQQLGKPQINILDANLSQTDGINSNTELQMEYELEQKKMAVDEICKIIINYCRVVTEYPSFLSESSMSLIGRVLFTHYLSTNSASAAVSTMTDDEDLVVQGRSSSKSTTESTDQRPSLFTLCLLLQNGLTRLNNALEERFACESNIQQLDQLKIEQLNNMVRSANLILGEEHFMSFFEKQDSVPNEAKLLCRTILTRKLLKLDSYLNTHINLLENTLTVLFRHINLYLQSSSDDRSNKLGQITLTTEQRTQLLQEATTGALNKLLDEILQLKMPKILLKQQMSYVDNNFCLNMAQRIKNLIFQVTSE
ncbi:hypothetical protein C9374_013517 [Naegleria lovaniensis]|uniref:Uncharacterized protein n=1 Tax=Naegleria lovaniensis TaxID=51637 RepID=A0AA88KQ78_NAELO|nr:uncharacterized protein C9374_013517 [Naegleria lovaniensis]KAG2392032.1 hypothetical protein C9374_013517 [Naegleria lovaniensis]